MHDPKLMSLLEAMDLMVTTTSGDVADATEQAALRLQCLERRLGGVAEASPYLNFLRRTAVAPTSASAGLAVSA
ncbi:MAG: hypothetical protein PF961_06270 [Planctomycetota bacterium]|jgi:hypothetical protein|nr:hypothetical protein [Planctomycetota bacterium]